MKKPTADPGERIEDLALYLRKWAKDHELPLGDALQEVVTAIFVATNHTAQLALVAETIAQEAYAVTHGAKHAYSPQTIDKWSRNVNTILRGRA